MINIKTLLKLENDGGFTLYKGMKIKYKSGWQVATEGVECRTADEALHAIEQYNGTCGVWYHDSIYYIDKSRRVNTKREALEIGRACNQISVLGWRKMSLAYC